jgi:glycosyltransferase involved in cell wall biosynthesis
MTVSVIIPTYNRASCICDAIDSVLDQTFKDYEILVIDDGSTDDTSQILQQYNDKIKYIYQKNEGVSAARNTGILNSRGEWLAFLDSDDIWKPDKLERQIEALRDTGASVCFSGHEDDFGNKFIDFAKDVPLGGYQYIEPAFHLVFNTNNTHPLIQSILIDKKLILSLGLFDQTLRVAEDTKLIYRIVFKTGITYINDILFVLKRNRSINGLSDDINLEIALLRHECYCRVQAEAYWLLFSKDAKLAKIVRANIGYFLSRLSEMHSVLKNHKIARSYAIEGLKYASGLRSFTRCLLLATAPFATRWYFSRKWKHDRKT